MSAIEYAARTLAALDPGGAEYHNVLAAFDDTTRGNVLDMVGYLRAVRGNGASNQLPPLEVYSKEPPIRGGQLADPSNHNDGEPGRVLQGVAYADIKPNLDRREIVEGVIPARAIIGIVSESGAGKSFFLADINCHVAAGEPWRGRDVEKGLVVVADLEGGMNALNRYHGWKTQHPEISTALPLCIMSEPINLRKATDTAALVAFIRRSEQDHGQNCVLVAVDTLARSMQGGDENSSMDMGAVIGAADFIRAEIGCSVVFTHHLGKDPTKGGRGHSSLLGALDTEIQITGTDGHRVAVITKQRDGPAGAQFGYRLRVINIGANHKGQAVTTCVVDALETVITKPRPKLPAGVKVVLMALQNALSEHGIPAPRALNLPADVHAVTVTEWRDIYKKTTGDSSDMSQGVPEAQRKAFGRGKERLIAERIIAISGDYVWIC